MHIEVGHRFLRGLPFLSLGAWLSFLAFDYSYSLILARLDPVMAASLRPNDTAAFSGDMNYRIRKRVSALVTPTDIQRAKIVLRADPLNRVALRTFGIREDLEGSNGKAFRWMALANKVTRRDGIVQLWLQEYFRQKRDAPKYWRHVNTLLLVKPLATQSLLPNMVSVVDQEPFRKALSPYIVGKSDWVFPLLDDIVNRDAELATAVLLPVIERNDTTGYDDILNILIFKIGAAGQRKTAETLARATYHRQDILYPRNGKILFPPIGSQFGKFSWNFLNTDGVSAVSDGGKNIIVEFSAQGTGVFVRKAFLLDGHRTLVLSFLRNDAQGADAAVLTWFAYCYRGESVSILKLSTDSSNLINRSVARLDIPDQCKAIELLGHLDGSDLSFGNSMTLKDFELTTG